MKTKLLPKVNGGTDIPVTVKNNQVYGRPDYAPIGYFAWHSQDDVALFVPQSTCFSYEASDLRAIADAMDSIARGVS